MNWGWKITIVYLLFAGGIMTLVMKSRAHKVDLVVPDYYQQELAYETRLNAMRNVETLSQRPVVTVDQSVVQISFPAELSAARTSGTVTLYCPSDVNEDKQVPIAIGENQLQRIETAGMKKGLYMVQMNWNLDGREYYAEQTLYLN